MSSAVSKIILVIIQSLTFCSRCQPDRNSPSIDGESYLCDGCSRRLLTSGALVTHRARCEHVQRMMNGLLNNVGGAMLARRKRNLASMLEDVNNNQTQSDPRPVSSVPVPHSSAPSIPSHFLAPPAPAPTSPSVATTPPPSIDDARPRRENVRLPERYRDNGALPWRPKPRKHVDALPEPLISTTSDLDPSHPAISSPGVGSDSENQQQRVEVIPAQTKCNVFGLYRQYRTETYPKHDPEAAIDRQLLLEPVNDPPADTLPQSMSTSAPCPFSEVPSNPVLDRPSPSSNYVATTNAMSIRSAVESSRSLFHPYPNWSSFRLGQWYWTGSPKKSESTFKELLDIVTDPKFCAEDLEGVNCKIINEKLLMGETH